jgi:hypothetical protein
MFLLQFTVMAENTRGKPYRASNATVYVYVNRTFTDVGEGELGFILDRFQ